MHKVFAALLAFCTATHTLAQMPISSSERAATFRSPFGLERTTSVIDELVIDLILHRGYLETTDAAARMSQIKGVTAIRSLESKGPARARNLLEIGVGPSGAEGYNIHLYGVTVSDGSESPNPDLFYLQQWLVESLVEVPSDALEETHPNLGRHMFQLSYIQADRALALLKALGYSTIEFIRHSSYDSVFEPLRRSETRLPVVVKMLDAAKTSLMDPFVIPQSQAQKMPHPDYTAQRSTIPDIGGTFLHDVTSGEPQQRLLIVYDQEDPESFEELLRVLTEQVDVPARQVVISALVVEVNRDRFDELGITFRGSNARTTMEFQEHEQTGTPLPFTFTFDSGAARTSFSLEARIAALVERGEAEILSNPSVLVLDGRQARIQIGKQVPVVHSTATAAGITQSVEYFPVGIVLNLRPRISADGTEVTMQVETIVSAVAQTTPVGGGVLFAPTVDNRQVQTFVRVGDSTPFIIGGLIATDSQSVRSGVPLLSKIPVLGALFRSTTVVNAKREVVVVLTPHVVPLEQKSFSYLIPKDSEIFDSSGERLFRNAYRLRSRDVFDLRFVYESEVFQRMLAGVRARAEADPALGRTEPFAGLLRGDVPGEAVLVRRMLWETIWRTNYWRDLTVDRMIFFEPSPDDPTGHDFSLSFLSWKLEQLGPSRNALVLKFDAENRGTPERPFAQPKAEVSYENLPPQTYGQRLIELNRRAPDGSPRQWAIILSEEHSAPAAPLDVLKAVLVLKRLLALNHSLPLTIRDFHVGRQIIFPTEEDVRQGFHVVDRDAARLFYEVMEYYRAFEQEFNLQTQGVMRLLED